MQNSDILRRNESFQLGRLEGARELCERLRGRVPANPLLNAWAEFLEDLEAARSEPIPFPSYPERSEQGLREQKKGNAS